MAFWNQVDVEPKRGFRWLLYVSGMPQFIVTKVKKPSFRIGTTPHDFLNYQFKYPGKVTWEDINFTVVDPVQPDSAASLYNILSAAGYVLPPDYQEALAKTISKKAMVESLGTQIKIVQLDADGNGANPLEEWTINNPQLVNVNFGQLDYSQEGLINIDVTLTYDWASLDVEGKQLWALNSQRDFSGDDTAS